MDISDYATLAGAVPLVMLITQVAKGLSLPRAAIRPFTLVLSLAIVMFAAAHSGLLVDAGAIFVFVVIGIEVAWASWSAYETTLTGTNPVDTLLLRG